MQKDKFSGWVKFSIGWVVVFLVRLLPFRPPNVEPILATIMPFSKRYKYLGGFSFGFLSIVLFDLIVWKLGMWTLITGIAYGLLGLGAYAFFKNRDASVRNFLIYGVVGTIAYDIVTGLSVGPLFFNQPFMEALLGQIPFTLAHLAGTIVFALTLSPALYRWVVTNNKLELGFVLSKLMGGPNRT
ncbi:MAG: hypothetical protein NUV96_00015 [Candidatus Colwellbacteria bacterium]|nr:hypothetical protein [Candidatus Colwellbacteria bacterium]